ncbi:substrate-binding domain-containing protein, partial [Microvirga sp. 3-52]|nr:substrate-binding domain-containing protein [Microvirga sp. 3-52]
EHGQRAMRHLLSLPDKPTAIFAVSDILAIGALKEINSRGLHVPDDIALIGFDKISFSNMTHPTLTTISQPGYEMGFTSAKMLIDKIKGVEVDSVLL